MSEDKPEGTPEKIEGFTLTVKPDADGRPLLTYEGPDDAKIQRHISAEMVGKLTEVAGTIAAGKTPSLSMIAGFMKKK